MLKHEVRIKRLKPMGHFPSPLPPPPFIKIVLKSLSTQYTDISTKRKDTIVPVIIDLWNLKLCVLCN